LVSYPFQLAWHGLKLTKLSWKSTTYVREKQKAETFFAKLPWLQSNAIQATLDRQAHDFLFS
jgi:hypothetical protein